MIEEGADCLRQECHSKRVKIVEMSYGALASEWCKEISQIFLIDFTYAERIAGIPELFFHISQFILDNARTLRGRFCFSFRARHIRIRTAGIRMNYFSSCHTMAGARAWTAGKTSDGVDVRHLLESFVVSNLC